VSSPPRSGRRAVLDWTAHPGVGLLVLFALAVALIWHGEPQPSSRPSGTSVGVSGTASADGSIPDLMVLRDGRLELLQQQRIVRTVALPPDAVPRSMLTSHGLTVVLAVVGGRQRAYAITNTLTVRDLGYADAVLPAAQGKAAVVVEAALVDPGRVDPSSTGTAGPTASASESGTPSDTATRPLPGPPPLRDYGIRRYDSAGRPTEPPDRLPRGYRAAVDTSEGMVVWQPVNRVFDSGVVHEALSASALLVRPDATIRALGPVHPLAADDDQLLVWDVALRRFGVMPLQYITSTATSTVTPSTSATPSATESSTSPSRPRPTPTVVAGTQWFLPTRGMLLVTGPAAFSADGSAFGVYAQVGSRRRLVVAQLKNLGTDQVQVLVLTQPPARSSPVPSGSSLVSPSPDGEQSGSGSSGASRSSPAGSSSAEASSTAPALEPDGYPIPAPATPLWLAGNRVVGVAQDGTVIGYRLGNLQSAQLDLGVTEVRALAPTP
jgi:hypothetical protein